MMFTRTAHLSSFSRPAKCPSGSVLFILFTLSACENFLGLQWFCRCLYSKLGESLPLSDEDSYNSLPTLSTPKRKSFECMFIKTNQVMSFSLVLESIGWIFFATTLMLITFNSSQFRASILQTVLQTPYLILLIPLNFQITDDYLFFSSWIGWLWLMFITITLRKILHNIHYLAIIFIFSPRVFSIILSSSHHENHA